MSWGITRHIHYHSTPTDPTSGPSIGTQTRSTNDILEKILQALQTLQFSMDTVAQKSLPNEILLVNDNSTFSDQLDVSPNANARHARTGTILRRSWPEAKFDLLERLNAFKG